MPRVVGKTLAFDYDHGPRIKFWQNVRIANLTHVIPGL